MRDRGLRLDRHLGGVGVAQNPYCMALSLSEARVNNDSLFQKNAFPCKNLSTGCSWVGTLTARDQHAPECSFAVFTCEQGGGPDCGGLGKGIGTRMKLAEHNKVCAMFR
mgnify:FL=1